MRRFLDFITSCLDRQNTAIKSSRFRLIEILRGISALAVALFHFNEPYPALSDPYHILLKRGWLGVPVFFVISGFCIASARSKDNLVVFWERRLLRIYPAYWASLFVVLCIVAVRIAAFGTNDVTPIPKGAFGWLYTVAALTSPASMVAGMNWAYWSLGYELAFYIIMGFFFLKKFPILIIGFSVFALIFSPSGYPFNQWGLFGLGAACHLVLERRYRLAVVLAAICTWQIAATLSVAETTTGVLTVILILFPPAVISLPVFEPLKLVGLFSYSLYLTHVPIGCYLISRCLAANFTRELAPSMLQDAILLSACLVFSYLFYRVVEKPTHEYARRKGRRRFSEDAAKV